MSGPSLTAANAVVPVRDIAATIAFYVDVLGFETPDYTPGDRFATVRRGGAALHLTETDDDGALRATANNISLVIHVDGLDALYEQLAPALEALPEGRLRAPFDQPYGRREFHVKDPDGCLLFFSEPVGAS